jgi:WD40 repeat protein/serine/threonine protein kinase
MWELFHAALEMGSEERRVYLDDACGSDAALRRELDALLACHEKSAPVLDQTATLTASGGPDDIHAMLKPERIGPYRILEQIGEGGMGTVWLAEQIEPIRRRVALKIIKLGMDTNAVIARFEAERQALAMMDHPNVAKVLDAGATEQGRPYFVMEHVQGEPITDYCDRHRLTAKERLMLFIDVCGAVQHAHQKAIIHRDIKPSNILVAIKDGKAIPKVIDFGVAKATEQNLTERTLFTEQGQLIGTPEYMSPEQAEMSALNVDTRTDIYALGVVLYELLVGALPFDSKSLRQAAFNEIQRVIREVEPPRPSTRLSNLGDEDSTTAAAKRRTNRAGLQRQLRGDLDWITLRAMDKDRTRRYANPSDFAEDLRRHINHEPVSAGPPSVSYRAAKFLRRNRGPVTWLFAMFGVIVLGASTVVWYAASAQERDLQRQHHEYLYHVHDAARAIDHGESAAAQAALARAARHLRGWEWRYLSAACDRSMATLKHDPGRIDSVQYSSDGEILATGSNSGTITLWDAESHFRVRELPVSTVITSVAISDDRRYVAGGDHDGSIWVFDAKTGEELFSWEAHRGRVSGVAFDPGSKTLASVSWDGRIRLWDPQGGAPLMEKNLNQGRLNSVAFNSTGRTIACGAGSGRIVLVDTSGQVRWLEGHQGDVYDVRFSEDGMLLASVGWDHTARIWDMASNQCQRTFVHGGVAIALALSPDGNLLASAGRSTAIKVWNIESGDCIETLPGHAGHVHSLAFRSHGTQLASGSDDSTVKIWECPSFGHTVAKSAHIRPVKSVAFGAEGQILASASEDGTICIWDPAQACSVLPGHSGAVTSIAFDSSANLLASGGTDGTVLVWDLAKDKMLCVLSDHADHVLDVAFAPGKPIVASASRDKTIYLWDVMTGEMIDQLFGHDGEVHCVAYHPSGHQLATGSGDQTVKVWNARTGALVQTLHGHEHPVLGVAYDSRGELLASSANDVILWDANTARRLSQFQPTDPTGAIAFSPDGTRVAIGHWKGDVSLWDVNGMRIFRLLGDGSAAWDLAFSPEGDWLVTGGEDFTIRAWSAPHTLSSGLTP